jgi:hypothetical protein
MKAFEQKQSNYLNNELSDSEKAILRGYLNADPTRSNTFFQTIQNYARGYTENLKEQLAYYNDSNVRIKNETDLKRAMEIFDGIFKKAPPLPMDINVYRTKNYALFLNEGYFTLRPGKIIIEKGYLSTMSDELDPTVMRAYGVDDTALVAGEDLRKKLEREGKYIKSIRQIPKRYESGPNVYVADLTHRCCIMKITVPKGTRVLLTYLFEDNENKHENEYLFPRGTRLRFRKHVIHRKMGTFDFDMLKRRSNITKSSRRKRPNWSDYTLKQLRDFARSRHIRGYSLKKDELIERLTKSGIRASDLIYS